MKASKRLAAIGVFLLLSMLLWSRTLFAQMSLILTDAPSWMHYLCDSSEPDPDGSVSAQGLHCYSDLTVPAGATFSVTNVLSASRSPQDCPRGALIAFVGGACNIQGTIAASASNTGYANAGGSGGGGGGAASTNLGQPGLMSTVFGQGGVIAAAAGGFGGNIKSNGVPGTTPTPQSQKWVWNVGIALGVFGGSAGGVGGFTAGSGAAGGPGGGAVVLICNSVDFTGTIDVSGGPGANAASGGGGGGGGGGGVVMIAAQAYPANTGAIILNGGAGGAGNGGGNGGAGGAGWLKEFTF